MESFFIQFGFSHLAECSSLYTGLIQSSFDNKVCFYIHYTAKSMCTLTIILICVVELPVSALFRICLLL